MSYTPPFNITPKIVDLVSLISEVVGKLEVLAPTATLGIEKVTAILKACEDELQNSNDVPTNVPKNVPTKRLDKILSLIGEDSSITIEQLSQLCEVSDKTIKRDIAKLKEEGRLGREGSLKSGFLKILK